MIGMHVSIHQTHLPGPFMIDFHIEHTVPNIVYFAVCPLSYLTYCIPEIMYFNVTYVGNLDMICIDIYVCIDFLSVCLCLFIQPQFAASAAVHLIGNRWLLLLVCYLKCDNVSLLSHEFHFIKFSCCIGSGFCVLFFGMTNGCVTAFCLVFVQPAVLRFRLISLSCLA